MKLDNIELDTEVSNIIHLLKEELTQQGINLLGATRDTPDNFMIACPYHKGGQERRPSAGIKKSDGTFHCFACGEVHTLPELISNCFGYNDSGLFGYQWLTENFILVERENRNVKLDIHRNKITFGHSIDSGASDAGSNASVCSGKDSDEFRRGFVSEEELESYRYTHPYMYKRGLTDEIIELFDIGYDKNTRCITFPVRDANGNTLFIARRSVDTKYFNYPAGAEKPLYGLYELGSCIHIPRKARSTLIHYVIVTESMLDALSFWTIHEPAVALNGLGNELQIEQLKQLPCRGIILATDMDEAGQEARRRLKRKLQDSKLIFEYDFPAGRKDANDCTKDELRNLKAKFV